MLTDILAFEFMQRALIGGVAIAIISAMIGTFLVLRRLSLLGDGLAHASFAGIAIGLLLNISPFFVSFIFTILASLIIFSLIKNARLHGDAAIALVLSMGMALAIVIAGLANGFSVNLFSFLFGSILSISKSDLAIITIVLLATTLFLKLFYRDALLLTFHEELAKTSGVNVNLINNLFAILSAAAIVVTIRAVGILLSSALLVIPVLIALQLSTSFKQTLSLSMTTSILAVIVGTLLSASLDIPTGGTIVTTLGVFYSLAYLIKRTNYNLY